MKPRLLIIEDDEDLRTHMKWALAEGYEWPLLPKTEKVP